MLGQAIVRICIFVSLSGIGRAEYVPPTNVTPPPPPMPPIPPIPPMPPMPFLPPFPAFNGSTNGTMGGCGWIMGFGGKGHNCTYQVIHSLSIR